MLPEFLSRGLMIVGWVGLWRPAELLVYDQINLPVLREIRLVPVMPAGERIRRRV